MWCGVVAGLMLINELTRSSKWFSYVVYILVPVILTFAVWPKTAGPESSVGTWFHWVKVYSALAGVLGFMYLPLSSRICPLNEQMMACVRAYAEHRN